jgi:uroporphyrinogen decarboxylase
MAGEMKKRDRVFAALKGDEVDRVPVSAWWHDFPREWSAQSLAEATVEAYETYDWDWVKLNPRASYYGEIWGAEFKPNPDRQPDMTKPAFTSAKEMSRLKPADLRNGIVREQIDSVKLVAKKLKGRAPLVQTVFSPLASLSRMAGSTKFIQRMIRDEPAAVEYALKAVTHTLARYSAGCIKAGADGIFFATVEWGSADVISPAAYNKFARPYDREVLDAVAEAPFNILHVCRSNNHLLDLVDYPVAAFNWATQDTTNPSPAEVLTKTDKAVIGGASHETVVPNGTPAEVVKEAHRSILDARSPRFLLSPGCAVPPATPEKNLRALAQAASP